MKSSVHVIFTHAVFRIQGIWSVARNSGADIELVLQRPNRFIGKAHIVVDRTSVNKSRNNVSKKTSLELTLFLSRSQSASSSICRHVSVSLLILRGIAHYWSVPLLSKLGAWRAWCLVAVKSELISRLYERHHFRGYRSRWSIIS